jgi:hypothetical protein
MPLGKHQHTKHGGYRKERSDSRAKNLREDYPEFNKIHGSTTLGSLKERFGVDSLNQGARKTKEAIILSPAPPSNRTLSGTTIAARPCRFRMVKTPCWGAGG